MPAPVIAGITFGAAHQFPRLAIAATVQTIRRKNS
jgi:hypothetical protein